MNIFKKVKNNLQYAHYRKLRDQAIRKMNEHKMDANDTEFKFWMAEALYYIGKCYEIEI